MSILLHNYLKPIKPQVFAAKAKQKEELAKVLGDLGLSLDLNLTDLVEYMLAECKKLFNMENKEEGMIILKHIKVLLPYVPKHFSAHFYLVLADSFLLSNDYEGAGKAVLKAEGYAKKLNDPQLQTKVYNMQFIINRTIGKDKALGFLLKSKELSEEHNLYDNIVFCDVNIGLMHLFKNETNKAVEYCSSAIDLITSKPYPNEKIIMPSDFFLQLFSDNPGLAIVDKNKETILNGVAVVLRSVKELKSDYEATRRLTILMSILKLSETLLEASKKQIDDFIDGLKRNQKAQYYSAVAHGISEYKDYKLALVYFERAIEFSIFASDTEQRRIRKGYSYTISQLLGVSMIYDLESSSQTTHLLKKLSINISEDCLLGTVNSRIEFSNAVYDSDAAFGLSKKIIEEQILESIKDRYEVKHNISAFIYKNSKNDILENLEIFVINTLNYDDELISLLFVGTTMDEKDLKKRRKIFSGYQIVGHIVPESVSKNKHFEDFDVKIINDLLRFPQRFKKIEILLPNNDIQTTYIPLFENK